MTKCEEYKNEMVSLLYEDEGVDADLQAHLTQCQSCQKEFSQLRQTQSFFSAKHDVFPSIQLEQQIFDAIAQQGKSKSIWETLRSFMLHPGFVAVSVFLITLVGTLSFKKSPLGESVATLQWASNPAPSVENSKTSFETPSQNTNIQPTYNNAVAYRMLDTSLMPRYAADLDRPVLKNTSLNLLEQNAVEAVSSFQHEIAYRHILDGDYQQATALLNKLIERDNRYSQWEQAVIQHLQLVKQMGDENAIQRDLDRIKAYAQTNPLLIQQAELIVK